MRRLESAVMCHGCWYLRELVATGAGVGLHRFPVQSGSPPLHGEVEVGGMLLLPYDGHKEGCKFVHVWHLPCTRLCTMETMSLACLPPAWSLAVDPALPCTGSR